MTPSRTLTFLGTGTSVGVPTIGCDCAVCQSDHPRNQRTRASVLLRTPAGNIIIDTGPEMRMQLLREQVKAIHAVLYTHFHADHLFGLDDLRIFPKRMERNLPVYLSEEVEEVIRRAFAYAFHPQANDLPAGVVPKLDFHRISEGSFTVLDQTIVPIPLIHSRFNCLGFRIGDLAYCTDVSSFPPASLAKLQGLKIFIVDCLRRQPHPAHMSLDGALSVIAQLQPEQAYLTHLSCDLDYETISATLPSHVHMAYDGLTIPF